MDTFLDKLILTAELIGIMHRIRQPIFLVQSEAGHFSYFIPHHPERAIRWEERNRLLRLVPISRRARPRVKVHDVPEPSDESEWREEVGIIVSLRHDLLAELDCLREG